MSPKVVDVQICLNHAGLEYIDLKTVNR